MSKEITRRLGRGLSSLISVPDIPPENPASAGDPTVPSDSPPPATRSARVDQLRPNCPPARKEMDPAG